LLALLVLFAGNPQEAVLEGHVDVVRFNTGELGGDLVALLRLTHLERWCGREAAKVQGRHPEWKALEQAIDVVAELSEWFDQLFRETGRLTLRNVRFLSLRRFHDLSPLSKVMK